VLAAMLMPYFWTVSAKSGGFNNAAPRVTLERLEGWRQRADWAQKNAFEAFPPFAAAVIIAQLLHADQQTVDLLAMTFIGARFLHGVCYIADLSSLRSIVWAIALGCVVALMVAGA
jgi:uncharacterized MAPEG superfamily protein